MRAGSPLAGRTSGAALLVAIFVMAISASTMVALRMDSMLAALRAENQWAADQAWYYLTGAEQLAGELVRQRLREIERDSELSEQLVALDLGGQLPTDDGWLSFTVEDLQGRFNLNSLLAADTPREGDGDEGAPEPSGAAQAGSSRTVAQNRFVRLVRSVGETPMGEAEAVALLEAVQDWLDADLLETGFGGAEQAYYAQQAVPYRPADGPLRDASELRLIKGVSAELYRELRPLVTVWPEDGDAISVSAAATEILQAMHHDLKNPTEPLGSAEAEAIAAALQEGEIATLDDLLHRPEWGPEPLPATGLVIRGQVFRVSAQTQVGRLRQGLTSVLWVNGDEIRILSRNLTML